MGRLFNRLTGITKAKRRISRATGIPWTKSGRRRKLKRAENQAIGCVIVLVLIVGGIAKVVDWVGGLFHHEAEVPAAVFTPPPPQPARPMLGPPAPEPQRTPVRQNTTTAAPSSPDSRSRWGRP